MSSGTHAVSFEHAIHTANTWLNAVVEALGTDDQQLAHRALRAWLHTFRDRLTVEVAAHFAAQLPELLRGLYYDGWNPSAVPVKYDREGFVTRYAHESKIAVNDVPAIVPAVTEALREHFSPGQLEGALRQFPEDLRDLFEPAEAPAGFQRGRGAR